MERKKEGERRKVREKEGRRDGGKRSQTLTLAYISITVLVVALGIILSNPSVNIVQLSKVTQIKWLSIVLVSLPCFQRSLRLRSTKLHFLMSER